MYGAAAAVSLELAKRATGTDGEAVHRVSPIWVFLIVCLNVIVFLPLAVLVLYTFGAVLPTMAMIEDPHASASYVELSPSLEEDDEGVFDEDPLRRNKPPRASRAGGGGGGGGGSSGSGTGSGSPLDAGLPITSSLRASLRQLYRLGGLRSLFRGLLVSWIVSFATAIVGALVSTLPFVPFLVGTLVANLALVQMHTAWVHIVVSTRPVSPAFWRRLPPFRRTFDATKYVVCVHWLATTIVQYLPFGVAWLVGVPQAALKLYNPNPSGDDGGDKGSNNNNSAAASISAWKHIAILSTVIFCILAVQIPALVALVRVQASILPPEEDTVVPFDRSFGGTVEPAVVNGQASVSIRDALLTFSRESWTRLYKLMAKVVALTFAVFFLISAAVMPQFWLIAPKAH